MYQRKRFPLRLVFAATLASAGLAQAASAALFDFDGSLQLEGLGALPAATGSGVATVNGSGGLGHLNTIALPAGFVTTSATTPVTGISLVTAIQLTLANAAGSFSHAAGTPPPLRGVLPVPGNARICAFFIAPCALFVDVPLTQNATRGVGIGGPPIVVPGLVTVTVTGSPWTTGTASVVTSNGTLAAAGFAHGPASATSSTAVTGGVVQLVTPIQITAFGGANTPGLIGRLTVSLVPEPGLVLLFASGAIALVLLGTRRR